MSTTAAASVPTNTMSTTAESSSTTTTATKKRERGKSVMYTQTSIGPIQSDIKTEEAIQEQKKGKWHVNAMGAIIFKEHDSYELMRQIQMGIRTSISDITPKKSRELKSKDFSLVTKQDFPNAGTKQTPPHEYPVFVFYSYADMCFRHLRERFGIDAGKFMLSVCHDSSLSILGTPGKSGALFFFSQDMKYILKTVTKKESKFLRKILPQYYNHVMANPSTLITRFYGLYSIKPLHGSNVRFIVMNNVFDTQKDVLYRYDLKGSLIGREASEKERSRTRPVLKDLDFLNEGRKIRVGPKNKAVIIDQMRRDTKFLESVKIMDYSLLLGVHTFSEQDIHSYLEEIDNPIVTTDLDSSNISSATSHLASTSTLAQPPSSIDVSNILAQSSTDQILSHTDIITEIVDSGTTTTTAANQDVPQLKLDGIENNAATVPIEKQDISPRSKRISFTSRIMFFTNPIEIEKHYKGEEQTKFQKFHGGLLSSTVTEDGHRDIYFIGVIDILQQWNNRKQLENLFKGMKYDKKLISSVNPKNYAARFCDFIDKAME